MHAKQYFALVAVANEVSGTTTLFRVTTRWTELPPSPWSTFMAMPTRGWAAGGNSGHHGQHSQC